MRIALDERKSVAYGTYMNDRYNMLDNWTAKLENTVRQQGPHEIYTNETVLHQRLPLETEIKVVYTDVYRLLCIKTYCVNRSMWIPWRNTRLGVLVGCRRWLAVLVGCRRWLGVSVGCRRWHDHVWKRLISFCGQDCAWDGRVFVGVLTWATR